MTFRPGSRLAELRSQAMCSVYFPARAMQWLFKPLSVKTMVMLDGWIADLVAERSK